jgi:hypothetical protein
MGRNAGGFSREFKPDAVALVLSPVRSIAQTGSELGVGESSLSFWLAKDRKARVTADFALSSAGAFWPKRPMPRWVAGLAQGPLDQREHPCRGVVGGACPMKKLEHQVSGLFKQPVIAACQFDHVVDGNLTT